MTAAEVLAQIEQVMAEPASASGDGHSATNHKLSELWNLYTAKKAEEALAAQPNGGSGWGGMARPARFAPQHPGYES